MAVTAGHAQASAGTRLSAGFPAQLDDQQFFSWRTLLEERTGVYISPERRSFLLSGLRNRMRENGCSDYAEYYQRLSSQAVDSDEWALLVDCLTVHETCFFRHANSMRLVEDVLLPEAFREANSYQAWSLGCATGEEAYSLGMLIDQYRDRQGEELCFGVNGTDISIPTLQCARAGRYLNRRLSGIRKELQQRYCSPVSDNRFEIDAELRKRVSFTELNLRDVEAAPFANLDLIYCQNLLIYYERECRLQIVSKLAGFLRLGGVLILGPGELLGWRHPDMEKVRYEDTLAFRRMN